MNEWIRISLVNIVLYSCPFQVLFWKSAIRIYRSISPQVTSEAAFFFLLSVNIQCNKAFYAGFPVIF